MRDDTELVRNLRTTENDRVRALRIFSEAVQNIEFSLDEQTCCAGNQLGQVIDRSLLTVNNTEAVRDEHVTELGKLSSECATLSFVLGCLTWVETQVLQDSNLTISQSRNGGRCRVPDSVGGEGNGLAE